MNDLTPNVPPTMRADLLPDEYRLMCQVCGRVTIHRIQQTSYGYGWRGECTEHATAAQAPSRGAAGER